MADDTTIIQEDTGFVPEPVPAALADTEINGLEPAQSDENAPVEEVTEDTSEEQPDAEAEVEENEVQTESEDEAAPTEQEAAPTAEQQAQTQELTGAQRRLAEKQQRDYVNDQRRQIRDYESDVEQKIRTGELDEAAQALEEAKISRAERYVDRVERNQMSVVNDVQVAKNEIPFFKQGTQQSEFLFQQAMADFANTYGDVDEETNQWLGASDKYGNEVKLLPYLQQQAAIYEQALADSQRTVQKTEAKMRAKAVNPSNPGKVTSSGDELTDLLDKIGDIPLTG